jgi:hypothetical protein
VIPSIEVTINPLLKPFPIVTNRLSEEAIPVYVSVELMGIEKLPLRFVQFIPSDEVNIKFLLPAAIN